MRLVRPVLGGTVLGFATLAGFSLVGVPIIPTDAHGLPLAAASRPAPPDALLTAEDLPPGFAPAPLAPAPPGADGCTALLANPAGGWAGAQRRQHERAGAALWEAVATPAGDALARLRYQLAVCGWTLRPAVRDGFAVSVPGGYVAGGRVGSTVVVVRYAGPDSPDTAPSVTLRVALERLTSASVK